MHQGPGYEIALPPSFHPASLSLSNCVNNQAERHHTFPEKSTTTFKMASGRSATSDSPHGKTEVKMKISAVEFGPFCVMDGNHDKNFRGGSYLITTPKDDFLVLHRLHGGPANEVGQYWTVDQRDGNEAFRFDMAVSRNWNSLQARSSLLVPKGVLMYEGFAASQGPYFGGGWQVFIPQSVVEPLLSLQKLVLSGSASEDTRQQMKHLSDTAEKAQSEILNRWNKKRIERITSNARNLALRGRYFSSLPSALQRAIRSSGDGTSNATKDVLPKGTYKLHEERIRHIDGSYQTLSLSVKTEFVKSTTRTYQSGRTTIVETTNYYNIIYIWS